MRSRHPVSPGSEETPTSDKQLGTSGERSGALSRMSLGWLLQHRSHDDMVMFEADNVLRKLRKRAQSLACSLLLFSRCDHLHAFRSASYSEKYGVGGTSFGTNTACEAPFSKLEVRRSPIVAAASKTPRAILKLAASSEGDKPCFYKPRTKGSSWAERIHLNDLRIGEELAGYVVQELLQGRTGPKVFFECGVGATDRKGEWRIVHGMLRLDRSKLSVARKRVAKLKKKDEVQLFVSRIQRECGQFEVCTSRDNVEKYRRMKPKIPITKLKANDTVVGRIVEVRSYGVLVDVGANRPGLLHIQKVADLYEKYIGKEKGLIDSGLEKGAEVRLMVASNHQRRLFLDFTHEAKSQAASELARLGAEVTNTQAPNDSHVAKTGARSNHSSEELAAWAEYAAQTEGVAGKPANEEDDGFDYDEDKDIEDAFGLGMY